MFGLGPSVNLRASCAQDNHPFTPKHKRITPIDLHHAPNQTQDLGAIRLRLGAISP